MESRRDRFAWKTDQTAAALILILVLAFMLLLTMAAFFQTADLNTNDPSGEHIDFYTDNVFLNLIMLLLQLCILYLFYKHCNHIRIRRMEIALLLWIFLLGTVFVASVKLRAPYYSDSYMVTYAAQRAAMGDLSILTDPYFQRFPFQLGYVLYSELFFRAASRVLAGLPEGYQWLALQEVNLLWLLLAFHAVLRSVQLLFPGERTARLTALLLFLCFQPVFSVTFLYGNIPAFACGCTAAWVFLIYLDNGKTIYALLTAILLTAAVTLKLNLLIFCVAIGGVWLIEFLKKRTWRSLICLMLTAVCVLTVSKLPQQLYEKRMGCNFGQGIPMIAWMAMGFDEGHAAPGWYSEEHTVTAFEHNGRDTAATAAAAGTALRERTAVFAAHPLKAIRFFRDKLFSQWNEPTYESLWLNQVHLSFSQKGEFYQFICGSSSAERRTTAIMEQIQQMVFLGMLLGCLGLWRKRSVKKCLLPLIILGGLLYHLLFEAKSQYALPYFVLMVPVAAYGLTRLFRRIENR